MQELNLRATIVYLQPFQEKPSFLGVGLEPTQYHIMVGIEPTYSPFPQKYCLVPRAGLEPARLAAGDFESPVSTNFTTEAYRMECM